jgi:hypothetical protein
VGEDLPLLLSVAQCYLVIVFMAAQGRALPHHTLSLSTRPPTSQETPYKVSHRDGGNTLLGLPNTYRIGSDEGMEWEQ